MVPPHYVKRIDLDRGADGAPTGTRLFFCVCGVSGAKEAVTAHVAQALEDRQPARVELEDPEDHPTDLQRPW